MENNKEYQKWLEVVEENGMELESVPEEFKTQEMCFAAVEERGFALKWVPEELKTFELCNIAVTNDFTGNALRYVPEEFKTFEMCDISVKNEDYGCLHSFDSMPEEYQAELAEKYDVKLPEKEVTK